MNKKILLLLLSVFLTVASYAQKFDTTGCSKYVFYQYDRFTEERELWSYDPMTVTNAQGLLSSPIPANSYKIEFRNNLAGKYLDKFASSITIKNLMNNDGLLKSQSNSGVLVYFIFEGNKKYNFKADMIPVENGYRIELPLQGEILMHYKTKQLTAIRITGNSIGNVDFDLDSKLSNHLLNELSCMFGYK